jgi:hypothetical protein
MPSPRELRRLAAIACFLGAAVFALFFVIVLFSRLTTFGIVPLEGLGFFACGGAALFLTGQRMARGR